MSFISWLLPQNVTFLGWDLWKISRKSQKLFVQKWFSLTIIRWSKRIVEDRCETINHLGHVALNNDIELSNKSKPLKWNYLMLCQQRLRKVRDESVQLEHW